MKPFSAFVNIVFHVEKDIQIENEVSGGLNDSGDSQVMFVPLDLLFSISQVRLKVDPDWKTKYSTEGRMTGMKSASLVLLVFLLLLSVFFF